MVQSWEMLREKALPYGKEAFEQYGEQMFKALRVLCDCSYKARESGLLALEETAEQWEKGIDVPLKELLIYGIQKLVDASDEDKMTEEILKKAEVNGYSGCEWYVVYVYLKGIREILDGILPEVFEIRCRVTVPEQWLEDYDQYCQALMQNRQEEKEMDVHSQFRKAASVRTAFHRTFQDMEPEKIRYILEELDYKTVAAGIVFAQESLRNRFLENMKELQRKLVMEEWYWGARADMYCLDETLNAMDRMMMTAVLSGCGGAIEDLGQRAFKRDILVHLFL